MDQLCLQEQRRFDSDEDADGAALQANFCAALRRGDMHNSRFIKPSQLA
jgi:hypothetical protein